MDCQDISDSFMRGEVPSRERAASHLSGCAHCRELFERDAELGRSLAGQAALQVDSGASADLFALVEQSVSRERGLRAWLRSRPTAVRFMVALLSVLCVIVVGGALRLRADFAQYPSSRVLLLLVYLGAALIAIRHELATHQAKPRFDWPPPFFLGALALPVVMAHIPATDASRHGGPGGALTCFAYGALLTLPTALLLWAFDRADRLSLRAVCLGAAALGSCANLLLELNCSNGHVVHVLLGHASVGFGWLLAWLSVRVLQQPTRAR